MCRILFRRRRRAGGGALDLALNLTHVSHRPQGNNYGKSGGGDMNPALEAMLKGIGLNSEEEGVKKPNQTKSKRACFDYQKGGCFRGANCR